MAEVRVIARSVAHSGRETDWGRRAQEFKPVK
jgi:hypothetical protein